MALSAEIAAWLRDYALTVGARGYVVGLSGGIDSACTAALCQIAMGDSVLGALLPCHSLPEDAEMANLVAAAYGLQTVTVDLGLAYDELVAAMPAGIAGLALSNIKPRLRMSALYALAQNRGYLVAGTGNKTELLIGYFTKYGDGGVDVEPLGDLYKRQVRALAKELGVPKPVIDRPPSAGLWAGQTDEGELGISYRDLDAALEAIEKGCVDPIEPEMLRRVRQMMAASAHKRTMPPCFRLTGSA